MDQDALVMTGATVEELWPLVRDFHYSKRSAGLVRHAFAWREPGGLFGETGVPLAGVTYSQPVNRNFPHDALELSRLVRRDDFQGALSQFVAWSLRWLKANTAAPFVLSYADTTHGHHGGIYQALNFKYVGQSESSHIGFTATDGSFIHGRVCNTRFNTSSIEKIRRIKPLWEPAFGKPKHLYIYPIKSKWRLIQEARGWRDMPYPKPDLVADEARSFVGAAA